MINTRLSPQAGPVSRTPSPVKRNAVNGEAKGKVSDAGSDANFNAELGGQLAAVQIQAQPLNHTGKNAGKNELLEKSFDKSLDKFGATKNPKQIPSRPISPDVLDELRNAPSVDVSVNRAQQAGKGDILGAKSKIGIETNAPLAPLFGEAGQVSLNQAKFGPDEKKFKSPLESISKPSPNIPPVRRDVSVQDAQVGAFNPTAASLIALAAEHGLNPSEDLDKETALDSTPTANHSPRKLHSLAGEDFVKTQKAVQGNAVGQQGLGSVESADVALAPGIALADAAPVALMAGRSSEMPESLDLGGLKDPNIAATLNAQQNTAPKLPVLQLGGEVVKGAGARDRFSTVALMGIADGISSLVPTGGGEMRIHLKPEYLGELTLKVTTRGNRVDVDIKTKDAGAKRILEDSMGYLKESLKSQSLDLGRVRVSDMASTLGTPARSFEANAQNYASQMASNPWAQQGNSFDSRRNDDRAAEGDLDTGNRRVAGVGLKQASPSSISRTMGLGKISGSERALDVRA